MRRTASLLVLLLSACRTGADRDPWAHLYVEDDGVLADDDAADDDAADDDAADDDAPRRPAGASAGDDDLDDDVSDDDTPPVASTDDDDTVTIGDDDVDDDDVIEPAGDDDAGDDDAGDDDAGDDDASDDDAGDDDASDDDAAEPECVPSTEVCDGSDNDCDEHVDEGFVCPPEPGVVGAVPYEGGVYFEGSTVPGLASASALQRFWPSVAESTIDGFDTYDDLFRIRRSDSQLFFINRMELHGAIDGLVSIEPCIGAPNTWDFDAAGVIAYSCGSGVFRAGQQLATSGIIFGVTDDGRVVGKSDLEWGHWQASEFIPADLDFGSATIRTLTATVQGNVLVMPILVRDTEIAVVKFDEQSRWTLMRRQPVVSEQLGAHVLALPDGTIFMAHRDPADSTLLRILAYLPDGSEVVAWHEADGGAVQEVFALFQGPLDPADILH